MIRKKPPFFAMVRKKPQGPIKSEHFEYRDKQDEYLCLPYITKCWVSNIYILVGVCRTENV